MPRRTRGRIVGQIEQYESENRFEQYQALEVELHEEWSNPSDADDTTSLTIPHQEGS